jgi:hypothetical protein
MRERLWFCDIVIWLSVLNCNTILNVSMSESLHSLYTGMHLVTEEDIGAAGRKVVLLNTIGPGSYFGELSMVICTPF